MKVKKKNYRYLSKILDELINEGSKLKKSLSTGLNSYLDQEKNRNPQVASNKFDLHYEEERDHWLESVDEALKENLEGYEWGKVFSKDSEFVGDYLNDLFNLKDSLAQMSESTTPKVKPAQELTIDTQKWVLRNNRTGEECAIAQTQIQHFIKILINSRGVFLPMNEFLEEFKKVANGKTPKECLDIKSNFKRKLKEMKISEKVRKDLITSKNGFTLNTDLVEIKE